jgi:putative redox protein
MKVATRYQGQMRFSSGDGAAKVVMDAKPAVGGRGEAPTPKEMVLHGLAGCTGLDVAAILNKKRVRFEDFEVRAEAEQNDSHPVVFKRIKITYHLKADPADRTHVERAIELSEKQFCGVSEMLRQSAEITWELELDPLD